MQGGDAAVTAALVAVVIALTKAIEWLVRRQDKDKEGEKGKDSLPHETLRQIRETYEQVRVLVTKDIEAMQSHNEKIANVLASISVSQERIVEVQSKTLRLLEKIDRRHEVELAVMKAGKSER